MKNKIKLSIGFLLSFIMLFSFFIFPTKASASTCDSVTLNGNIATGTLPIRARFTYGTDFNTVQSGRGIPTTVETFNSYGPIQQVVFGLAEKTTYFFRLESTNSAGTSLASIKSVTTLACQQPQPNQPQQQPSVNISAKQTTTQYLQSIQGREIKSYFELGAIQISAIFIVILTTIAAYVRSILLDKRQRFIKASDDFKTSFNAAIHVLETKKFCDREVLRDTFADHEKAMLIFREHLKGSRLASFNKDWHEYKEYYDERMDIGLLGFIAVESLDPARIADLAHHAEVEQFRRKEILTHINRLRSYAK